jgi:dihydrofolate synthase/folylpolyglutamate synthase
MDVLGRTRAQIASEKAGIIKEGIPTLVGPLPSSARRVIGEVARERHAPIWSSSDILSAGALPGRDLFYTSRWTLPLLGDHQTVNAGVAIAAALLLDANGLRLTPSAVRHGIRGVQWPGRFQVIPGQPVVVYDVAHNPSGIRQVAYTWRKHFGSRRAVTLFTTRVDKDYGTMWRLLAPCVSQWIGCPLPHSAGIAEQEMARMALAQKVPFEWHANARIAFRRARACAGSGGLVLIVGSHYLVGELMRPPHIDLPAGGKSVARDLAWTEICRLSRLPL